MLQISNVPDIVSLADLHTQKACKLRNVNVPDTDMQCLQWTQSTSKIVTHGWSFKHKLVDFLRSYQNHALVQCPLVPCQMSPINPVKRTFFLFYSTAILTILVRRKKNRFFFLGINHFIFIILLTKLFS